jgi:hypothetical protein
MERRAGRQGGRREDGSQLRSCSIDLMDCLCICLMESNHIASSLAVPPIFGQGR